MERIHVFKSTEYRTFLYNREKERGRSLKKDKRAHRETPYS